MFRLGEHFVACGSATDRAVLDQLVSLAGVPDLVWTDPPYGVDYVGKTDEALTIRNDERDATTLLDLLVASLGNAFGVLRPGGVWYIAGPSGPMAHVFTTALVQIGGWRQTLTWVKDVFVLGHSDYHYRQELVFQGIVENRTEVDSEYDPIYYGWTEGQHIAPGDRRQDTVWNIARPKASREHPTMKPVALVRDHIEKSTYVGNLVLDVFGGSGTTLVAAQEAGRRCAIVELDPHYVDVILARFERLFGVAPERVVEGPA